MDWLQVARARRAQASEGDAVSGITRHDRRSSSDLSGPWPIERWVRPRGRRSRWQRGLSRRKRLRRRGQWTIALALLVSTAGFVAGLGPRLASQMISLPLLGGAAAIGAAQSAGAQPPAGAPGEVAAGAAPASEPRPAAAPPPPRYSNLAPAELIERLPPTPRPAQGAAAPAPERLVEEVAWDSGSIAGPVKIEYSVDARLVREVAEILERGHVELGHAIVMDPRDGRLLAYASTAPDVFPPTGTYPAASLVKVITAATVLDRKPEQVNEPCRFVGSPYQLTPARVDPPARGESISLERALATSNNQCFAQLAVHAVGKDGMVDAIDRFGWSASPAPAHQPGRVEPGPDRFGVGQLGCGLSGCHITPLHAAQLAASLVDGLLIAPYWVDGITDARGVRLVLPSRPTPRRVMSERLAAQMREMMVETTQRGTARKAFRTRSGGPRLGPVEVAGKTGSLSGRNPTGRYEWFIGVAPASAPRIAVATLVVQGDLWWRSSSQIAADIFESLMCENGRCSDQAVLRWLPEGSQVAAGQEATKHLN